MKNKKYIVIIIMLAIIGLLAYYLLIGNKIAVTSISLEDHQITLIVGEHKKLDYTISPVDATDKEVIWESSNSNIVSVSNGIISANKDGDSIITIKSKDGKVSDKCNVKVLKNEADTLELSEHDIEVRIGDNKQLNLTIIPEDLQNLVIWSSGDPNIATVSESGLVTGVSNGYVEIKASYGNKEEICNVKVVIPVNSLEMEKESLTINVDEPQTINLIVNPENAINQEIKWTSSNEDVAVVAFGKVTGLKEGTTTITATVDGKSASCNINVIVPVKAITLNKTDISLKNGNIDKITATITPSNATNQAITWSSSNPSVITVDNTGKVTSIKTGMAIITATVDGKSSSSKVISTGYVITEDTKFNSLEKVDSYNSDTLRYRITKDKGNFVLVWVMDANKQWNAAMPSLGNVYPAEEILSKEINTYGYQKKGLVATNASYFWDGWGNYPCTPFIMNKGSIIRDIENKDYGKNVYSVLGLTKNAEFKTYHFNANTYTRNMKSRQEMIDDGVRNSFTYSRTMISESGGITSSTDKNNRTVLCQVDANNYVIYSGGSLNNNQIGRTLKNTFGCKVAYNLDGGGSRKLYYKTNTMLQPTKVYGGDRALPDMMYFVEQ